MVARQHAKLEFTGQDLAQTGQIAGQRKARNRARALRFQKRMGTIATMSVAIMGPILALATFLVLGPLDHGSASPALRFVLLADLVYVIALAALVLHRVVSLFLARRARSAGSKLHLRLTRFFATLALLPTIIVAVFAVVTVNFGLEGWFSERVQRVLTTSLAAAQAYEDEHRDALLADSQALARFLDRTRNNGRSLRENLVLGQNGIQRGLKEAFIIDSTGELRTRGERSYLFDFEQPREEQINMALAEGAHVIEDWDINEFRAIVPLTAYVDRYLYVSREVDGEILNLLDETKQTVSLYEQLESDRGQLLFEFGLIYIGFALIVILSSIWAALWFSEQLARPVGRLANAVQRVGEGELDTSVPEESHDDEFAMLGRYFNQMTRDLKDQRGKLIETSNQNERRRRLFDSVLSSVTSGVLGLDAEGQVDFANRSAERLLDIRDAGSHRKISETVPEFAAMFSELISTGRDVLQGEVRVSRGGKLEILLVRMSRRLNEEGGAEGYVIAFDDVTNLVSAQRMAAWGDVARRIAHEIKNPLTPIQLSAERIRRKYTSLLAQEDQHTLSELTDVIVRQTNDLRRIVDEFSKFARMPEPSKVSADLNALISSAVTLQSSNFTAIRYAVSLPDGSSMAVLDPTMISQVLTNLLKNAAESVERKQQNEGDDFHGEIKVTLKVGDKDAKLTIADNGVGLPEDRTKLFEPYYTTRAEGTGLGLPIVKKIVEDHGGTLQLESAHPFDGCTHQGAMAIIHLPLNETETIDGTK